MKVGFRLGRVGEAALLCLVGYFSYSMRPTVWRGLKIYREMKLRLRNLHLSSFHRAIRRLRKAGLVTGSKESLRITAIGQKAVVAKGLGFSPLAVPTPREWDGRWRIVAFDVPERAKFRREVLRRVLADLGFVRVQHSVWAHPADCRKTVADVVAKIGADREVAFVVADSIDGGPNLLRRFKLG